MEVRSLEDDNPRRGEKRQSMSISTYRRLLGLIQASPLCARVRRTTGLIHARLLGRALGGLETGVLA